MLAFAAAFSVGAVRAELPLDRGLFRPQTSQLFLDFNHVGAVDRTLQLSPTPEYVLAADMDGDGIESP